MSEPTSEVTLRDVENLREDLKVKSETARLFIKLLFQKVKRLEDDLRAANIQRDAAVASFNREIEATKGLEEDLKTQTEVSEVYAKTIDCFLKEREGLREALEQIKNMRTSIEVYNVAKQALETEDAR